MVKDIPSLVVISVDLFLGDSEVSETKGQFRVTRYLYSKTESCTMSLSILNFMTVIRLGVRKSIPVVLVSRL